MMLCVHSIAESKMAATATENKSEQQSLKETLTDLFENLYSALITSAFTKPCYKAVIYWLIVVAGSFLHDFLPIPNSYFSNKRNVFNVYFVKIGWGWTWGLLSIVVILSSWVYTSGNIISMCRHYCRLLVATTAWFLWVTSFGYIEHWTGVCKGQSQLESKRSCHRNGFLWRGFDISGHAFLLIHCALTISEEIQAVKYLEDLESQEETADTSLSPTTDHSTPHIHLTMSGKYWNKLLKPLIKAAFICTALLMLLWEGMLVTTCLYFHTVQQKVLGALIATFTWWGTYHYMYKQQHIPFIVTPAGQKIH